jgi:CitMHS family citrate-Mg2+:H+ or citrate-Ca2+:H+ symporter
MLPAMAVGLAGVFGLAWLLGGREKQRLGHLSLGAAAMESVSMADSALVPLESNADAVRRPKLLAINALLTLALLVALVVGVLPLPVLFMIAFAVALVINYPKVADQRERIAAHAKNVIAVVSLIFAAGIFTGILQGSGMLDAMAKSMLGLVPPALGPYLAPITALASLPFTFFVSNDAFYFGVVPIVAETARGFGISPLEIARASLIGQPVHLLSPLVPSTYLLVGLAGVEFGDHQRFTLKWAALVCLLMLIASLVCAVFPLAT